MRISSRKHSNLEISNDTSGVTIPEELTSKYNAHVVEYALKLKAKNGNKYSDEFYLEYARKVELQEMNGKFTRSTAKKAANCPIQDPQWYGYSYEEILQMENNGYTIPEDVLLWAHAQQESDITAYEIISSESETDDNTSTSEITGDFDLNNLQKKAKEYTTKSKKAEEEAQNNIEEYNVLKEKANKIKQEKEDSYQDSIKEISTLTKEWKELDKKSKNGTLSSAEQKRYGELGKLLGNNSSIMEDIQIDSKDLDELLSSMNLLETNADKNITLANETIKSAVDLAGYETNYNSEQKTYNTSGIVYSDSGLLTDLMFGASGTTIQRIALDAGNELSTQSNTVITNLNTPDNTELTEFATSYTQAANKALKETQNAMGSSNNDESKKTQMQDENSTQNASQNTTTNQSVQQPNKTPQNKIYVDISSKNTGNKDTQVDDGGKNPNFFVLPVGGRPELALIATTTSALSTANLKSKQKDVNNTDKTLQKDLAKTNKEVQRVTKEADRIEQKHAEFLQRAEVYSAQLEMLMAEEEAKQLAAQQEIEKQASKQSNIQNNNAIGNNQNGLAQANQTQNTQNTQNTQSEEPQQGLSPELEATMEQMNYLYSADQEMLASLGKPITKAKASVSANQKAAKSLQAQNSNLDERNSNNKKVQRNTIICGSMTTALGAYNMAVAVPLLHTGIAMASFPPTAAAGTALVAFSTRWIIIASLQLTLGPGAIAAGTVGLVASSDVSDDIKEHDNTYGDVVKASNANNKALRLANNVVTRADQIVIPDTTISNNTKPQNNNNKEDNTQNLSTSRTTNMTFQDVKDITKFPQGPTNLSNPLNDTRKKSQQNNTEQDTNNNIEENLNKNTQNQTSSTGVSRTSATNDINRKQRTATIQKEDNNENQQNEQIQIQSSNKNVKTTQNKPSTNPVNNTEKTPVANNTANTNNNEVQKQNEPQSQTEQTIAMTQTKNNQNSPAIAPTNINQNQQTSTQTTTATEETTTEEANNNKETKAKDAKEKEDEENKQNKTKEIAQNTKNTQAILYNQVNSIENENQSTANNSEKVNDIFKNNLSRLTSIQQQFEALNTTIQNTDDTEVSDEINSVRNNLETGSDRINTIITNTNNKIGLNTQPTDETINIENDTEIIELERQRDELDKDITDESSDNTNILAASASTNANTNATTITDDKAERKLARFNIDSIIESKKKKKKVMAVSAASGGSVKG